MKAILFDLGDTLEANGSLVPRALETLSAVQALIDSEGNAPVLGLVSDFTPAATPESVAAMLKEYYAIIGDLAIRPFFEPVAQRVTISTEVGVSKPDEKIFRVALDKILPQLPFQSAASFGPAGLSPAPRPAEVGFLRRTAWHQRPGRCHGQRI